MKPTLGKKKTIRGRIVCHTATIGPFEGQGETPALAIEACDGAVTNALARLDRGMFVHVWRGHVAIVAPSVSGWVYWIDTMSGVGRKQDAGSRCTTREQAMDRALHHLAQNVWELSVADDVAFVEGLPGDVAEEIASWICFQRSYVALRAEGKSDVEAHRLACGS
jgi:hypothetical protein